MSTELFRRYIDIINENQQPQQLDEGMLDSITTAAKAAVEKMSPGLIKKVTDFVEQTLGKPVEQLSMADVNMPNIKKLIAANSSMTEADVNPQFTVSGPYGDAETAVVPGSLNKNKASATKMGGILGAVGGFASAAWMSGADVANSGTMIAVGVAAMAILIAIIARSLATPDRAETGRVKTDLRDKETYFDPARRDPRLGAADQATTSLPKPTRQGFL